MKLLSDLISLLLINNILMFWILSWREMETGREVLLRMRGILMAVLEGPVKGGTIILIINKLV